MLLLLQLIPRIQVNNWQLLKAPHQKGRLAHQRRKDHFAQAAGGEAETTEEKEREALAALDQKKRVGHLENQGQAPLASMSRADRQHCNKTPAEGCQSQIATTDGKKKYFPLSPKPNLKALDPLELTKRKAG